MVPNSSTYFMAKNVIWIVQKKNNSIFQGAEQHLQVPEHYIHRSIQAHEIAMNSNHPFSILISIWSYEKNLIQANIFRTSYFIIKCILFLDSYSCAYLYIRLVFQKNTNSLRTFYFASEPSYILTLSRLKIQCIRSFLNFIFLTRTSSIICTISQSVILPLLICLNSAISTLFYHEQEHSKKILRLKNKFYVKNI